MGTGVAVVADELGTSAKMNLKLETVENVNIDGQYMKIATGALAESGQNSKIFSWQNTIVSADVIVHKILIDITTPSALAAQINVGQNAAEVVSDNMIDGQLLNAALVLNSMITPGANGEGAVHVADDEWITGYEDNTADPANLVGKYYIYYTEVA